MSENIARSFFEALGSHGEEEAMAVFHRSSITEGPNRAPSPRAQAVIDSGEWDTSRKLRLIYVRGAKACWGVLPRAQVVADGPTYIRFCTTAGCTVSSHANQKVPLEKRKEGWYLEAGGTARAGACLDVFFPAGSEGPIVKTAEPLLVGDGG